jgi:hypothetical protein
MGMGFEMNTDGYFNKAIEGFAFAQAELTYAALAKAKTERARHLRRARAEARCGKRAAGKAFNELLKEANG